MIKSVSRINSDERERYQDYLKLFYDVFDRYQNYLHKRQEVDFADLLKLGTEKLKKSNSKLNSKE